MKAKQKKQRAGELDPLVKASPGPTQEEKGTNLTPASCPLTSTHVLCHMSCVLCNPTQTQASICLFLNKVAGNKGNTDLWPPNVCTHMIIHTPNTSKQGIVPQQISLKNNRP